MAGESVQDWTSRAAQYLDGHIKRLLSRLLVAEMADLRKKAFDEGEGQGRLAGYRTGFDAGKQQGWQEGHDQGSAEGYAQGQMTYRLVDERTRFEPKPVDDALYGPRRLRVTPTNTLRMRDEVAAAANLGIVGQPTDEQWTMILADHPATCVSAGAGSGKSTTLVLRIVFMVQCLGIPLDSITVVSFTNASSRDLREKLARVLGHWQRRMIAPDSLKRTVSTFHSLLLRISQNALPGATFFERLDDQATSGPLQLEVDAEAENPGVSLRLSSKQQELLDAAYREAYQSSSTFREHVTTLLACELAARHTYSGTKVSSYKDGFFWIAAQQQAPIMAAMTNLWSTDGWIQCGVRLGPIEAFRHKGQTFCADGQIGDTGPLVLLDMPPGVGADIKIAAPGGDTDPLAQALDKRHRIFAAFCERRYITVRTAEDLKLLTLLIQHMADDTVASACDPPKFSIRLPGEVRSVPITEALYQQGSFIAALGWEVVALLKKLPAPRRNDTFEYNFAAVLALFWPYFEAAMDQRSVITYDRAFLTTTQDASITEFDHAQLERVRHILIDEFQDISPLIAHWVIAIQSRLLAKDEAKEVSIMAIGDDWQSIYGWRGSSPELFLRFPNHFRTHGHLGPAPMQRLTANFRSIPEIVHGAAKLIEQVTLRDPKTCTSVIRSKPADHGLKLHSLTRLGSDPDKQAAYLRRFVLQQYEDALQFDAPSEHHVLVMARSNRFLAKIKDGLPRRRGLRLCTYHQAKGLEADIAIMVEDCLPGASHSFRNMVYEASGCSVHSYDQSKADEAYRLAYVGVTRGKHRVHWFVPDDARFASNAYGSIGP